MQVNKAYSLIVQNLQEVVGDAELKKALQKSDEKVFQVYWGTATTGKPHVAYFVPICKIADMLHAGAKVTILFADLHAYLDNMKSPWSILCHRANYYETVIKAMLESVGVSLEKLFFVRGSQYELTRSYSEDVYRICTETSIRDARKAGAEVVKQVANPLVSGLLYPLLQALDEEYLHVDAQFGGIDQRKIFMMCERILPRLGYKKRIHLMNPMVPGLTGGKMSASEAASKIDLLESSIDLRAKLNSASCPPGQSAADGNGVLAFIKFVVFSLVRLKKADSGVTINAKTFSTYEELEAAYIAGDSNVTDGALKDCIFEHLDPPMEVVRNRFKKSKLLKLLSDAYPTDEASCADKHATESVNASLFMKNDQLTELKGTLDSLQQTMRITKEGPGLLAAATVFGLDKDKVIKSLSGHVTRVLWSVKPTGLPHLGLYLPIRDLALLSKHFGFIIIVVIEDIGAFLEGKCPWNQRESRFKLYETVITAIIKSACGDMKYFRIVRGSNFECEGSYMLDLYRLVSLVPENDAAACSGGISSAQMKALESEDNEEEGTGANLSALLLPCMKFLDAYHLKADILVGSPSSIEKQERFAQKFLPRFDEKFKMPFYTANTMLPALIGAADVTVMPCPSMSPIVPPLRNPQVAHSVAAQAQAKVVADQCIPLVEPPAPGTNVYTLPNNSTFVMPALKRRLKQTFCQPGNDKLNPILDILKMVIIPEFKRDAVDHIVIPRPSKHGGPISVKLEECELDKDGKCRLDDIFASEDLHPGDLKAALEEFIENHLRSRLAKHLPDAKTLNALIDEAFPIPSKKGKNKTNQSPKAKESEKEDGRPKGSSDKTAAFDPMMLEFCVGVIVGVDSHPNSTDYKVCQVSFGKKKDCTSVISLPKDALINKKAIFMTNLKPTVIEGVTSEVKVICVDEKHVFEISEHPVGTKLQFKLIGKGGAPKGKPVVSPVTNIDYEGHPGWQAFFADVYRDSGNLCWRNNWRLMVA
nr:tyrosyl tRNA synthetase [Hymenolepis microstoma]